METFIKLYDWTASIGLTLEERVVFSLIHQMTEMDNLGFWAGYKIMSERTGIQKSKCKKIVAGLIAKNLVSESRAGINGKLRIVLKSDEFFTNNAQNH